MLRKLRPGRPSHATAVAYLALFVALGGTGAYAANTVFSTDIVDGEVKAADIGANAVDSARVRDNTLNTFDVHSFIGDDVIDGTLTSADIQDNSLGNGDFLTGSVDSRVVTDDSLTSGDIQDLSLGNGDFLDGSVNSRVVTDNSLTSADIGAGAVGTSEVSNNSLTGSDIDESTLVGVKDGCHAGAVLLGRLCAGSDSVDRTFGAAANFCASIGLRLPTWGEAILLAVNNDVPGIGGSDHFWTDEVVSQYSVPQTGNNLMVVDEAGNGVANGDILSNKTLCVEEPSNL